MRPYTLNWLRPLLVTGQLVLAAMLALMASQRQLTLLLVLPLGIGMVLSFLRWPPLGLIAACWAGFIVPYLGPSGLNASMILVALLLGLWLFDMIVGEGQLQLTPSRTLWPLGAFLLAASFSFGFGQLNWFSFALHAPLGAQLGGLAILILSAGTFLLMANQVRDLRWLSRITWAFIVIGALSVIVRSVLPEFGLPEQHLFQQMGTVFYVWMVGMTFSQAFFNTDLRTGWRWVMGGFSLIFLFYILFYLKFIDKSGWISAFACVAAIIVARSWRAGLALVPLAVLAIALLWSSIVGTDEYSITTRFDAWIIMGQIIRISPLLGLGFANYYWYTPLFPIRGYAISFNSHNNYVDIIAQTGLVGLVCLLWLWWEIGRLGWQLRERVPEGFAQAYVYGAFGGLAGMVVAAMLGDWVLPFFYNIGLNGFRSSMIGWLFLGGLVSLEKMVRTGMFAPAPK